MFRFWPHALNNRLSLNIIFHPQEQDDPSTAHYPDYYVEHIRKMSQVVTLAYNDNAESRLSIVDSLRTALRTQPLRYATDMRSSLFLDAITKNLYLLSNIVTPPSLVKIILSFSQNTPCEFG